MTEPLLLLLLLDIIAMKGFYHARIYSLGERDVRDIPAWLRFWSEQHIVSIGSDITVYTFYLLLGVHWLALMGTAVFAYSTVFNGLIQISVGNSFWSQGPKDFPVGTGRVRRYLRDFRIPLAIAGIVATAIGLNL